MGNKYIADCKLSNSTAGLVAEYLAAASILQRGWGVALASQDSVDLVAWNKDTGQRFLVQVKSCQFSRGNKHRLEFNVSIGGNKRLPIRSDFDIMALVSVEQRSVFFLTVSSINVKRMNRTPAFFENPDLESDSWQKTIEELQNELT
jgi:hypothetical protein